MWKSRSSFALSCTLVLLLPACGDSYEGVAVNSVGVLEEVVTLLEGVKDRGSAVAVRSRLETLAGELETQRSRMAELARQGVDDQEQVDAALQQRVRPVMARLAPAMLRIRAMPAAQPVLGHVMGRLAPAAN